MKKKSFYLFFNHHIGNHFLITFFFLKKIFLSPLRQCHGQSVSLPTETPFRTLHEVFACFSSPSVTHSPMATEPPAGPSVHDSLRLAFDDASTADVRFVVEGREIHVHKAILKIRCEHFRSMFQVRKQCWARSVSTGTYMVERVCLFVLTGSLGAPFSREMSWGDEHRNQTLSLQLPWVFGR